jgi:DNA-binding winged helix-turn-helix (wHTH) protein
MTPRVSVSICGEVERPARLALAELRSLMDAGLVADFHCRGGWSRLGERWRGVPCAFQELLARVRANLRPRADAGPSLLRAGRICLDLLHREVTLAGRTVDLSDREFFLLKAFVGHPRQTLTRQELLSTAWGMTFDPGTNLVDVYVGYLRRKLGETVIETVRGAGYRLRADGPASIRTEPGPDSDPVPASRP